MTDIVAAGESLTKEELQRWLSGVDIEENDDTSESDYELALKILGTSDLADALKPDDGRTTDSLIGTEFTILSCSWRKSTKKEDGEGRYGFLWCVDADGVKFFTTCGATQPVLLLARLMRDDMLPIKVGLEATKTNSGNTMKRLVLASPDF